jgi:hypothetical protein
LLPIPTKTKEEVAAKITQLISRLEKTRETFQELNQLCEKSFVALSEEERKNINRAFDLLGACAWHSRVQTFKIKKDLGDKRLISR